MRRKITFFVLIISCLYSNMAAQNYDSNAVKLYIEKYKDFAISAMKDYKIPASIKLAQGIYHTQAGTNHLAINANNHFGMTCPKGSTQSAYYQDNNKNNLCFKKYQSVQESYEDHSRSLSTRSIYIPLFKLDIYDYRGWANGLLTAGYTVNKKYPQYLIEIIENYNLTRFDKPDEIKTPVVSTNPPDTVKSTQIVETKIIIDTVPPLESIHRTPIIPKTAKIADTKPLAPVEEISSKTSPLFFTVNEKDYTPVKYSFTKRKVYENNKTKFIIAQKGDTFEQLALELQFPEFRLKEYNDLYSDDYTLQEGEVVYLEAKGKKCSTQFHTITFGESLRYIAQKYGIQLKVILKNNQESSFSLEEEICISCK